MAKITFRGTGHLNGPVPINKTIEIDSSQVKNFTGSKSHDAIVAVLATHYPGVRIEKGKVGMEIILK